MVPSDFASAAFRVYVSIFRARKKCPDGFMLHDLTRLMTGLMGAKPWSWRVVGITRGALERFAAHEFKRPTGEIERGHIVQRAETARRLFEIAQPLDQEAFIRTWLRNDRTVLMLREENRQRDVFPAYIKIKNPDGRYFPSGTLIGWQHRKKEVELLRSLHANTEGFRRESSAKH